MFPESSKGLNFVSLNSLTTKHRPGPWNLIPLEGLGFYSFDYRWLKPMKGTHLAILRVCDLFGMVNLLKGCVLQGINVMSLGGRITWYTPRKLTCPLTRDHFKGKVVFHHHFFRAYVSCWRHPPKINSSPQKAMMVGRRTFPFWEGDFWAANS